MESHNPPIGLSERQAYQQAQGMQFRSRPPGMVIGPIGEGSLDLKSSWESMKPLAQGNLMFTLTSPYMLAKPFTTSTTVT